MQEIGTAVINKCNIKLFIFDDADYASIRMNQRSYFGGSYVGCDTETGLGFPQWKTLFKAWGIIDIVRITPEAYSEGSYMNIFDKKGFAVFIVSVDLEQTYYPKISSRVTENGLMESNPIHLMTPQLEEKIRNKVFKFVDAD